MTTVSGDDPKKYAAAMVEYSKEKVRRHEHIDYQLEQFENFFFFSIFICLFYLIAPRNASESIYRNFVCIRHTFLNKFLHSRRGCVFYSKLEN